VPAGAAAAGNRDDVAGCARAERRQRHGLRIARDGAERGPMRTKKPLNRPTLG
jgi:hypothetical protein